MPHFINFLKTAMRAAAVAALLPAALCCPAQSSPTTLTIPDIKASLTETHGAPKEQKPFNAVNAFFDAPTEVFPTIDKLTRMDMVDYFNSGSNRSSKNAFKGNCRILTLSHDQLSVATSDVSEVEISLLPEGNDSIIMVITTLKTPTDDSSVKFYTRSWKPIEEGLFIVPVLSDWTTEEGKTRKDDLENAVPFMLARISYVPSTATLTLTNNLGSYLPEETLGLAKGALKGSISYRWTGKKMERVKD